MPWKPLIHNSDEERAFEQQWRRTKRTKFLVDESLGEGTAQLLRKEWKANVEYAPDVGLAGHSDSEVFAYAWKKRRVLLTHDHDFLDDRDFPEHRNPGVVVLPGGAGDETALIKALYFTMLLVSQDPSAWIGTKVVVNQNGEVAITQRYAETGAIETTRYRFTRHGPPLIWEED